MTTTTLHPAVSAYRRAQRRRKENAIIRLIVATIVALLCGWLFMLAVGIAHHDWVPALPPIGYGTSVLILTLLRAAFATVPSYKETP